MIRSIRTTLIATGAAAAVVVGGVAPAFAAESTPAPSHMAAAAASLGQVQQHGEKAVDARLAAIDKAITKVDAAKNLTAADHAEFLKRLNHDETGLKTLRTDIAATKTVDAARADDKKVDTEFRVYEVLIPQLEIAGRTDQLHDNALPKLDKGYEHLKAKGADQAELAKLKTMIDAARKDLDGLGAKALAVTPKAYDSDHAVMKPLRDRLKDALVQVRDAAQLERTLAGDHAKTKAATPGKTKAPKPGKTKAATPAPHATSGS